AGDSVSKPTYWRFLSAGDPRAEPVVEGLDAALVIRHPSPSKYHRTWHDAELPTVGLFRGSLRG
ncbi:MAG TPA: hypothetical protein VLQ52_06805, partial [Coriobacteriia bacterium]|nr:hypothetical protein [Coriobacteriia bacterium]